MQELRTKALSAIARAAKALDDADGPFSAVLGRYTSQRDTLEQARAQKVFAENAREEKDKKRHYETAIKYANLAYQQITKEAAEGSAPAQWAGDMWNTDKKMLKRGGEIAKKGAKEVGKGLTDLLGGPVLLLIALGGVYLWATRGK